MQDVIGISVAILLGLEGCSTIAPMALERGQEATLTGLLEHAPTGYRFIADRPIRVENVLIDGCANVLPSAALRELLRDRNAAKRTTFRGAFFNYPDDLGYRDSELISTNIGSSCELHNPVLIVQSIQGATG